MFRSGVRRDALGRLVKSWMTMNSELFTWETQILQTFCVGEKKNEKRKANNNNNKKLVCSFLMSIEITAVNKDAF